MEILEKKKWSKTFRLTKPRKRETVVKNIMRVAAEKMELWGPKMNCLPLFKNLSICPIVREPKSAF